MDKLILTKEQLKSHVEWQDENTFTTCIKFSEFPKELINVFSDLITEQDITDGCYLCCEYWLDENYFVYEFNFESDTVSVNDFFNKSID